jgi:hypothetical protein
MDRSLKDDPLAIRSEVNIGLKLVVVFREIDEPLRFESAIFSGEKVNPLAVARRSNAIRTPAVAGKALAIG